MIKKTIIFFSMLLIAFDFLQCQIIKMNASQPPDLVAYQLWIWPDKPTSREWFEIRTRVYNKSNVALNQSAVMHIYVGGSTTPYKINISSLGPNDAKMYTQKIFLSRPGKYLAKVVVDPGNKIREIREDNNSKQIRFRVYKASSSEYLPDLTISKPHFDPKKPCTDDPVAIKFQVYNHGAVTAPASRAAIKIGNGRPILINIPPIEPENFKRGVVTRTIPVHGNFRITAYSDYGNNMREYNETNNNESSDLTVFSNCCADLVAYQLWIWPNSPKAGENFKIRCRIYNKGLKPTKVPTEAHIFVGGSTTPYVLNIGRFAPESARMFIQTIKIGRKGKYRARLIVDPNRKITECKENNNNRNIEFRVK